MTRVTLAIPALALLVGCQAKPTYLPSGDLAPESEADRAAGGIYDVSFDAIRRNPSPELMGMTERPMDVDRNMAVNQDQSNRMIWSDLGRMWFTDQPSPLSPYPTVKTSGTP